MWTVFAILFLLLSAAMFVLRHAFPVPFFARHFCWWGGAFFGIFVLFQLWFWLRPAAVPLSANEAAAVRSAVTDALESIEKGDGFGRSTAAVVHFVSDPTDEATAILRRELAAREGWTLVEGSPAVAFVKSLAKTVYEATSVDEYLRPGSRVGIDVVFYGILNGVSTEGGVSRASMSLTAYDTRTGSNLFRSDVSGEYPRVHTAVGRAVVAKSRSSRAWIFAVFALVLPWAASPLFLRVLARRTNGASALALFSLVAIDAVAGLFLFYGISSHVAASLGVLAVCAAYDLLCCEILSRRAVR